MKKNLIAEEKMEQMLKDIEKGILDVARSENFLNFLKFQSKNYCHSIKNTILANVQFQQLQIDKGGQPPLLTVGLFKGQEQWNEVGRDIKPDETPLEIFSPIIKKKLERDNSVPYINYTSLKVDAFTKAKVILRDIVYSNKGLYVYMVELIELDNIEVQGVLRVISKEPLEYKTIYNVSGKIDKYRSLKQLSITKIERISDLTINEKSYCAGFKLTPVFSQHQTYGKEIPSICNRLEGESESAQTLEKLLLELIDIPITYDMSRGNGYYVPSKKIININPELLEEKYICQRVKTLIHEYTHYKVDIMDFKDDIKEIADKSNATLYALEELVAESVAYMICNIHGIDTGKYSFEYLASWSCTDIKLLQKMLNIIQRIYSKVIKEIIQIDNNNVENNTEEEIINRGI